MPHRSLARYVVGPVLIMAGALAVPAVSLAQSDGQSLEAALKDLDQNKQAISDKEKEIADLDRKINELRQQRDSSAAQAELINAQLQRLTEQLTKARLQLAQTRLNIQAVQQQRAATEDDIGRLQREAESRRVQLRTLVRQLYEQEQESYLKIFFSTWSLSSVLAEREVYVALQQRTVQLMDELRQREEELTQRQVELDQQQQDLGQLHQLLVQQQKELSDQQSAKTQFLAAKRQQQLEYEHLLAEARQARQEIEQQVFTLKNVGVQLALKDAYEKARFAGRLTGVRPALLLAVLKVETNVGERLGSGIFPDDMHPASREPFLRITRKLGLDPATTPISARPKSYPGWGGAMGPAQIMPETWERIEDRVAQLMGKPLPNPYELTDALVATSIFLADRGATDPAKEYEAVNRYLAGPNWQHFTWYGDRVLAVAKEYEKDGLL